MVMQNNSSTVSQNDRIALQQVSYGISKKLYSASVCMMSVGRTHTHILPQKCFGICQFQHNFLNQIWLSTEPHTSTIAKVPW